MMMIYSLLSASQMKVNRSLKFTATFTLSGWVGEDPQNLELLNTGVIQLKLGIEDCLLYNLLSTGLSDQRNLFYSGG